MRCNFNHWLLVAVMVLLTTGCATMQSRWKDTESVNTIAAYEEFLERYPKGELADKARSRIEELYFKQANAKDTISAYEEFLERYPKGELADKARTRLESLDFQEVKDTNTIAAYEVFLTVYPEGKLANEARRYLQNLKVQIKALEKAAKRVLPREAKVEVTSVSRFPKKPEFLISAHLLEGYSADETSPYVRGDYGTHEKLTRLVRYRCARILKSISRAKILPDGSEITIRARHGVRQSYFPGGFGGTDVAMTIYEISIPTKIMKERDLSSMSEKSIMNFWKVTKNIIPSLHFQIQYGW